MQRSSKMVLGTESLDTSNLAIITHAIQAGINSFDTADCYGNGASESALGIALSHVDRKEIFIASKCGVSFGSDGTVTTDGSRDYIFKACDASLQRLQTEYIDLYYLHRVGQHTRIEESVLAMKELIQQGKIKGIGLSEVTADQIRRAHAVHPIAAVQIEYSPWSRQDENNDVIQTCRELNIAVWGYSPLGRAFFTAQNENYFKNLSENDYRKLLPRYNDQFLVDNLAQRAAIDACAKRLGCTTAQLVLAWECARNIIPVFGTTNAKHFDENIVALTLNLSHEALAEVDAIIESFNVHGDRYPSQEVSGIFPEQEPAVIGSPSTSGFFACRRASLQLTSAPSQPQADIVSEKLGKFT